ncbi:MAG: homoserine kinase [Deltaproteobacteria bacterium]|nr:MAG: homoserine kinase [Deltaproteobacteria bacterium]
MSYMSKTPLSFATAFAPASIGNVAVGFDILGLALEGLGDTVLARRIEEPTVRIAAIEGCELPVDPARNTAGAAILALREARSLSFGIELSITKGIPLCSGMGGSAASAVAAVVAAEALLDQALSPAQRLALALAGEAVASGSAHADNVAPSLLGGLVLAVDRSTLVRIPTPSGVQAVVIHPALAVDTLSARAGLREGVPLADMTRQTGLLGGFLAGCFLGDPALLRASLRDVLIEPQRQHLVPGLADVLHAAREAGALGGSISGAGPAVFAWAERARALEVRRAMIAAFAAHGIAATGLLSNLDAPGARLLDRS